MKPLFAVAALCWSLQRRRRGHRVATTLAMCRVRCRFGDRCKGTELALHPPNWRFTHGPERGPRELILDTTCTITSLEGMARAVAQVIRLQPPSHRTKALKPRKIMSSVSRTHQRLFSGANSVASSTVGWRAPCTPGRIDVKPARNHRATSVRHTGIVSR